MNENSINDDDKTDIAPVIVAPEILKTPEKTTEANDITTTTKITPKTNENIINVDENTIPAETKQNPNRKCYPKHCSMPSTWETTAMGETRDFVQILKERYGDRIRFLRDTTHFPKNPTYVRKRGAFIPGYHMERQRQILF
ncbi:hypothetical protein PYW08_008618 [Mythimna loreyi]|uniref:Uncharacterized protein n=1 Tax=Mythimna loreyi TaxID=667449 RepID=A0ACC2Q963_9NEOP|nr:hypothetical protein PYW08_008618 [Mythimna loreyi]